MKAFKKGFSFVLALVMIASAALIAPARNIEAQAASSSTFSVAKKSVSITIPAAKKTAQYKGKVTFDSKKVKKSSIAAKSANKKIATAKYDSKNQVVVITAKKKGNTTVKVTAKTKSGSTLSRKISVKVKKSTTKYCVTSLTVSSKKATIKVAEGKNKATKSIKVNVKGGKKAKKTVTAKTSNSKIATVKYYSKSKKIVVTGKKKGNATITIKTKSNNKYGNKLTKKVKITVNKNLDISNLAVENPDVLVNNNATRVCRVVITGKTNDEYDIVDSSKKKVGTVKDNGLSYDDIANDGVYSGVVELYSAKSVNAKYYVLVNNKLSETYGKVYFYKTITEEENAQIDSMTTNINKIESGTTSAKTAYKNVVSLLKKKVKNGEIKSYKEEKDCIQITLASGIKYIYMNSLEKNVLSRSDSTSNLVEKSPLATSPASPYYNQVATFQPYASELITSVFDNAATKIANSKYNYKFLDNFDDSQVSIEQLKGLNNYNVIIWNGHGGYSETLHSFIGTGTPVSYYNDAYYSADLRTDRLVPSNSGRYVATAKFFDRYYNTNDFGKTLFYIGTCHGADDKVLANTLINKGVDAVCAFKGTVNSSYDRDIAQTLFTQLASDSGPTVEKAVQAAKKKHGNFDPYHSGTELMLIGDKSFKLGVNKYTSAVVANLSFESGLQYWDSVGDCRVLTQLSKLSPIHGANMCLIGTGLGSVSESNSAISRTFTVSGAKKLSFYCDYVSEEPMEYFGSQYDDTCIVTVTSGKTTKEVARYTINTSNWKELDGNVFNGGDSTTYHIGWRKVTIDLTNLPSKTFTITFNIWDEGDSIYDSAMLLDNFVFEY